MTRLLRIFAIVAIPLVVLTIIAQAVAKEKKGRGKSQTEQAVEPPTKPMTVWQARKSVIAGLQRVVLLDVAAQPSSINITGDSVEFVVLVRPDSESWNRPYDSVPCLNSGTPCKTDLKRIGEFTVDPRGWADEAQHSRFGGRLRGLLINGKVPLFDNRTWSGTHNPDEDAKMWSIALWRSSEEAQSFADAMNRLRSAARGGQSIVQEAGWPELQQKAAVWRALAEKPAISEDVRRHRILAENAVKENRFDSAIEEYEAGLEINPTWPEGHFNAALLCAEMGYYSEAMHHMRAYLELTPEAPDAQQARDQLVIWEAKLAKP